MFFVLMIQISFPAVIDALGIFFRNNPPLIEAEEFVSPPFRL